MRRKLIPFATVASLVFCAAAVVLWVAPVPPWPNHGRGTFFFSVEEKHRVLRTNVFRTIASPSVSPAQDDVRAYVRWYTAIPGGPVFQVMGFGVSQYPWFKGSKVADGRYGVTHVGTHWSVDIPFVAIVALFALLPVARLLVAARRRFVGSRVGGCGKCGYDLTGNTSGVCPECGSAVG